MDRLPSCQAPRLAVGVYGVRFWVCTQNLDSHTSRLERKLNRESEAAYVGSAGVGHWFVAGWLAKREGLPESCL